jgi:hypothetical protein
MGRLRRWSRRSGQDNDIVVSRDKSVSEQAANEAAAPTNDDAIPHIPIQLESVSFESLTELSCRL